MKKIIVCFLYLFILFGNRLYADEVSVAVASNFSYTLQQLAADFKEKTGHVLRISSASSGKLFAQIKHGAPYDVYLSADEERPDVLIKEGRASIESSYVYALGKLVLLSNVEQMDCCKNVLTSNSLKRLAIANPKIAPYGKAAKQVLNRLDLWQSLQQRLVMGENIAQTLQFVSTKNAEAGFVAESMINMAVLSKGKKFDYACRWEIPADLYSPIKQKMVLLSKAKDKTAALEFFQYIKSSQAKEIIKSTGYNVL